MCADGVCELATRKSFDRGYHYCGHSCDLSRGPDAMAMNSAWLVLGGTAIGCSLI
jgi:hypothetical protein